MFCHLHETLTTAIPSLTHMAPKPQQQLRNEAFLPSTMTTDALQVVVQDILAKNNNRRVNVLVIGLGGGSDAQHAFIIGQHVMSELVPECQRGELVFGTNKWAENLGRSNKPPSGALVPGSACGLFSVQYREWTADELNESVNGRPRWVGTTMFEATIPPTKHEYDGRTFTSPVVIPLMKDRSTAPQIAKDLAMLSPGAHARAAAMRRMDLTEVGDDSRHSISCQLSDRDIDADM
jgi:hypothetical protein